MSVAASWAQRMLRVWRGVAPPKKFGAPSSTSTDAPDLRALIAAQSAALPPPITSTSNFRERSTMRLVSRFAGEAKPLPRHSGARSFARTRNPDVGDGLWIPGSRPPDRALRGPVGLAPE